MSAKDTTILIPSDDVVDTIVSGNNNFVSTLDHLPCDLIRSLWIIQMMNLRNKRLNEQLSNLLISKSENNLQIERLNKLILRNSFEAECESKFAVSILLNHLNTLNDDLEILNILKLKLPGWTSEAVEKRWMEWNDFKKSFLNSRKSLNFENKFDLFLKKYTESNKNESSTRKNISNTASTTVTNNDKIGIKLKLKLKNTRIKRKSQVQLNGNLNKKLKKSLVSSAIPQKDEMKDEIKEKKILLDKPIDNIKLENEPLYCFCRGPSFGKMVACENEKCPNEWFHFKCVGLTSEPKGLWFCSKSCRDRYNERKEKKKKRKRKRKGSKW